MNHHIALALIGFKLHFNLKLLKLPQKVQNFRLSTPHSFGLVTGLMLSSDICGKFPFQQLQFDNDVLTRDMKTLL